MVALYLPTLMFITAASLFTPGTADCVQAHTGAFKGTARNAAGPLQLEGASTSTVFQVSATSDSLHLTAITSSGRERTIASWPLARVICAGEMIKANGTTSGPQHLRRTMMWNMKGGIRAEATISTKGLAGSTNANTTATDDFFGGAEVQLTLLKVR